jgi:hypothetical protein
MPGPIVRFDHDSTEAVIPEGGDYAALVHSVKERISERGNATIHVVYELSGVDPAWEWVSEYFVIAGLNARAVAIGQRRLLLLCRACGVEPCEGDEVDLGQLVGRRLELRLGHELFEQRKRLRVLAHRRRP